MDRTREAYEPLDRIDEACSEGRQSSEDEALLGKAPEEDEEMPFSRLEYAIFCLLGIAMLWAWNMFLAAAPYFAARFAAHNWIAANSQSAIMAVSTVTNLVTVLVLSHIQSSASYSYRINLALALNTAVFALLALSTAVCLDASPARYFVFLLLMVGAASYAAGLLQNGGYAFAAGFSRRPEYMQAIIAGQGIAGVLPAIAQVVSVALYPPGGDKSQGTPRSSSPDSSSTGQASTSVYFTTAVAISAATLVAMCPLVRRHRAILERKSKLSDDHADDEAALKPVPLGYLFRKLRWLAAGVVVLFISTMFFPVLTTKILSVDASRGTLFQTFAFIPLGLLCWNAGDLAGRVLTALPQPQRVRLLTRRPFTLFVLALLRIGQLPLYLLCNVGGRGAVVRSDLFYLLVVQFGFGLTNGWLFSNIMIASGEWVDESEREATGGFMGLCLVAGLAVGSLLSFTASGI